MSKFIVTPNYRNRSEKTYRWLVREADKRIETTRACKAVRCTGVRLTSADAESSFGCGVVAECESVICEGLEPLDVVKVFNPDTSVVGLAREDRLTNLTFGSYEFYTPTDEAKTRLNELLLLPDGQIQGDVG